jgi:hypothetical protein
MSDAFDSPRRKIDWAQHHIHNVKRVIDRFYREKDLYAIFAEPHSNIPQRFVCKMRLAKQPPWFLDDMVADAVTNLRSALDHAMFAASSAGGKKERFRRALFPFGRTESSFENSLGGNCSDVPPEILPLIRSYKPYKGGESLPSTPPHQFSQERRTGDPAACWAMLSPSRIAGLDCVHTPGISKLRADHVFKHEASMSTEPRSLCLPGHGRSKILIQKD